MTEFNKKIINPTKLNKIINNDRLKIIDCRWYINDKKKGREEYNKGHIPNAIYFDIEKNSDLNNLFPHMLPKKEKFLSFLKKNGISIDDEIVIYDQTGFFCSSRVWFTFTYYNFKNIKILNGGIKYWNDHNYEVSKQKKTTSIKKKIKLKEKKSMVANLEYIKRKTKDKKTLIIDARPRNRFLGLKEEPRKNLKKGNIPGSINIPFTSLVDKKGRFLSKSVLKKKFEKKINFSFIKRIICTCGSGITACNIIFGLNLLGVQNIKLYDGSWAEWGKK
jgi:thiosulfate/3-mercaptopyruvate sulfurtransferase|tara:strand:- start:89 stop:916 length:828 start_codon:yes stop_codon:yes gene_type:complete